MLIRKGDVIKVNDTIYLYLEHRQQDMFYVNNIINISNKTYEIQERLASGGNAVVHKCVELISGEEFAIKFQLTPFNKKRIKRFKQEIALLRQIKHEQLVNYIEDGEIAFKIRKKGGFKTVTDTSIPFIIMQLANENLTDFLKRNGSISYADYIAQFRGLASALATLHGKAIHRDIKPENILVSGETWILSDFGLCKFNDEAMELTADYEVVGPRYWMSPEALNRCVGNADEISKSSDVYQLCSIFWYVVTGRHPMGIVSEDDWKGPQPLFRVIYDSLSHDSSKRPCDGGELLKKIEDITI
ncbi:hypothetical protein A6E27_24990 [Bacillus cereus]|nr:hypothetical protein A6E27_24990 [Bacillus cereus]